MIETKHSILFPQGGLGNQMIQYAYISSLQKRCFHSVEVNLTLFNSFLTKLRNIKLWRFHDLLYGYFPLRSNLYSYNDLISLFINKKRNFVITDQLEDIEILSRLAGDDHNSIGHFFFFGYFQRYEAFSEDSFKFWDYLLSKLELSYSSMKSFDEIAVHIRLGDYCEIKNKKIYSHNSISSQLAKALQLKNKISSTRKIIIFSDSPELIHLYFLENELMRNHFMISHQLTMEQDFKELSTYKNIIGTNSTFSLCAGMLSWRLSEMSNTPLYLSDNWFVDSSRNKAMLKQLSKCSFIDTNN